jgi:hypothetical protein
MISIFNTIIINPLNYIFFNPILIFSRIWYTSYLPLVNAFNLSMVNHNTLAHSHLLSLIYAIIISGISPIGLYMFFFDNYTLTPFIINVMKFMFYLSTSYFFTDLILGIQYYPYILQKNILTFAIHHNIYICALLYGNYVNKLQYAMVFLPLEIPTVLLSLGYIYEDQKYPTLFGILFFIFRILYNSMIILKMRGLHHDIYMFSILTLSAHIYWFSKYVKKYIL